MKWIIALAGAGFGLTLQAVMTNQAMTNQAMADEIRHTSFAAPLIGTWAQSADFCAKKDKSNFVIAAANYVGPDGACTVEVIVETAGSRGPNYSVRGRCSASPQDRPHIVNVIMRPEGADHISIGSSFTDLKLYQRCPAKQ